MKASADEWEEVPLPKNEEWESIPVANPSEPDFRNTVESTPKATKVAPSEVTMEPSIDELVQQAAKTGDWSKVPASQFGKHPAPEEPGVGETAGHQFLHGFTKRTSDELYGELGGLYSDKAGDGTILGVQFASPVMPGAYVRGPSGDVPLSDRKGVSNALRDVYRKQLEAQKKAHGGVAFGAGMAGDVASDVTAYALGAPSFKAPAMIASGAVAGASDVDSEDVGDRLLGGGLGAGASAVGLGVGKYAVPRVAKALAPHAREWLMKAAQTRAAKAAGAIQGQLQKMPEAKWREAAETLLRLGIIKPFRGPAGVQKAAEELQEKMGPAVGATLKRADEAAMSGAGQPFEADRALEAIRQRLSGSTIPERRAAEPVLQDIVDTAREGGGFQDFNKLKGVIRPNWADQTTPIPNQVKKMIVGELRDSIDSQVEQNLGAQVGQEFMDSKKLYGAATTAAEWGKKGAAREAGNRAVSPSDYATILGSLASGNVGTAGALGLGVLHNIARSRGSSVLGPLLYSAAKGNAPAALARGAGSKPLTEAEQALLRAWLEKQTGPSDEQ